MAEGHRRNGDIVDLLRNSMAISATHEALYEHLLLFQMELIVTAMQCGHRRVLSVADRKQRESRLQSAIKNQVKQLKRVVVDTERLLSKCTGYKGTQIWADMRGVGCSVQPISIWRDGFSQILTGIFRA
jgi:hypothetical protein